MSGVAISVDSLSKTFDLHRERRNSAKERFVRGRAKSGGRFVALNDLTFDIPRGTTFGSKAIAIRYFAKAIVRLFTKT